MTTHQICRRGLLAATALCFILATSASAQRSGYPLSKREAAERYQQHLQLAKPIVENAVQRRGNIQLALRNNGTFGSFGEGVEDPFTGTGVQSCVYPRNSDLVYLWVGAFWVGAVVGRDTLVSVGTEDFYQTQEFWPDEKPFGDFRYESIDINSQFYSRNANSEEDIIAEYSDTNTSPGLVSIDPTDGRPHRPLNIKVTQRSMAWSYSYADDFILFDYAIENIGDKVLSDVYMGIWVDGDAWHTSRNDQTGWNDDLVGFYRYHPAPEGCGFIDTVNIAWHSDNNGDPEGSAWSEKSVRSAMGSRVVRTPSDSLKYSFNWWIINYGDASQDFGPRRAGAPGDPFRNMGSRLGTPEGDRNKYYVMAHREFDYDLLFTAIDHSSEGWLPPPANADLVSRGYDSRYLLSFGPFDVEPGQRLPISFAWVAGPDFHTDPNAFETLMNPQTPEAFNRQLNFGPMAVNSRWANWIYDNPGVDSDGDGYFGKHRVCVLDSVIERIDTAVVDIDTLIDTLFRATVADTFFYEGDGVPDFRGAGPPPAPRIKIIPTNGKLVVRWNGFYSETTPDIFTRRVDFEGYRVYLALDNRASSYSLVRSYDLSDFARFRWLRMPSGAYDWVQDEIPFTLDSLRLLYNDSLFNPVSYTRSNPLDIGGEYFAFEPQDYNQADLSDPAGIHKAYPGFPRPTNDPTQWTEDMLTHEFGDPLPKYYVYEYTFANILPTVPYFVSVTAFDYGSPLADLPSLETEPVNNTVQEYALTSSDSVVTQNLDVYVYPNPYRVDGNYVEMGYENRGNTLPTERARRINFVNLPPVCKISIYSLDGDLVRVIEHNTLPGAPGSQHDFWDLITRNTQAAVSGIYYWVVESAERTQIGKLVLIR